MLARHIQRVDAIDMFALDPQELAARRNNGSSRTQTHDRLRQSGGCVDDVFAIVEYKEKLLSSDGARDGLPGNVAAAQLQAENARDHRRDETGIRQRNQINQPAITVEGREEAAANLQSQLGLTDPSRA